MWEICDRERSANQSIDGYAELHSDVLEPPVLTDKKANKVKGMTNKCDFFNLGHYYKWKFER
jgi:hypothetical protein